MLSIFSYACWPSVCLPWRNVYLGLLPFLLIGLFVFSLLNCMSYLLILNINPLSIALFASIFSRSIDCLFILLMVSFAVQKLINWIRFHLFIFAFISFALENWPKKTLLWSLSKNVLCMFSSKAFTVSCFILRSPNHFRVICVYGMKECSNFIDLHISV